MSKDKIIVTKKHTSAMKKIIAHFGSKAKLCRHLNVSGANGYQWASGLRVISLCVAEQLDKEGVISFLESRPDMEKYRKYYK